MRRITTFNFVTLNGFFKRPDNDINWHKHGEEENEYSIDSLKEGDILLFGRTTYEMMEGFWESDMAKETNPKVAKGMNNSEKIVFSTTMQKADWNNTTLIKNNIVEEIRKMKATPGNDMAILGSGTIVTWFAEAGLIDDFQIMVDPVAIGAGVPTFDNLKGQLHLKLTNIRV
jgi:dihydrofolate reductase